MVRKYQLFSLAVPIRCGLMDFPHNGPIPSWLNHALTPLSTLPPLREASLLRLRSVAVTPCAIAAFTVRPRHALNSSVNRRAPGKWWYGTRSGARPHHSQRLQVDVGPTVGWSLPENELRIEDLIPDPCHVFVSWRTCDKIRHSVVKAPSKKQCRCPISRLQTPRSRSESAQ